jgi:CRISPR/Cas system-associated endonuclease Cas1
MSNLSALSRDAPPGRLRREFVTFAANPVRIAGVSHTDNQYRDSFAYDVMEPIRPYVDEWLLDFTKTHLFSKINFYENKDGGVRLTLKLTPYLAETLPLWANKIEPVIEQVKAILINDITVRKENLLN